MTKMSVALMDVMGNDLSVINAARVSMAKYHAWWQNEDDKLIKYLARNGHWTPFAHPQISIRIKAPIFVARQLVKHQVGLVWNEVSRRYVTDDPEFWEPDEWRGKPIDKKQGSDGVVDISWNLQHAVNDLVRDALSTYKELLASNVAPEMARTVLPLSMFTEWIWTGSLYAFVRVCKERIAPDAQGETQEIGRAIHDILKEFFPICTQALLPEPVEERIGG